MPRDHETGLRTVTDVRRPRRGSKARTVVLDGEAWRTVPVEVLHELGVGQGDLLDPGVLADSMSRVAPRLARERAFRLLAYRERSTADITARLLEDGYDPPLVGVTVEDLVSSGFVDDERYGRLRARQLIEGRGLGRSRALRELTEHGITSELASTLVEEFAPMEDEAARARTAAARLTRSGDSVARLASRLVRRGYSAGVALRAALAQLGDDAPDESLDDAL